MTEKKVKEVFPIDNGLMSGIMAELPDLFTQATDLDLLLISKCGNRLITPIVELLLDSSGTLPQSSILRLAKLIASEYGDGWTRIKSALTVEYNPLTSGTYHEEITEESEGETGDNTNETSNQDVSAFNTTPGSYLSDGKSTSESQSAGTDKRSLTRTLDRTSNNTNYRTSDVLRAEIDMRINSRLTETVITDVKNYIAMQIY